VSIGGDRLDIGCDRTYAPVAGCLVSNKPGHSESRNLPTSQSDSMGKPCILLQLYNASESGHGLRLANLRLVSRVCSVQKAFRWNLTHTLRVDGDTMVFSPSRFIAHE
jgi:hypothetical protein